MDMLCGNQTQGGFIALWKSATSATYAKANSTVFSMLCSQQTIHPIARSACQSIMCLLSLTHQNISTFAPSRLVIAVLTELVWHLLNQTSTQRNYTSTV